MCQGDVLLLVLSCCEGIASGAPSLPFVLPDLLAVDGTVAAPNEKVRIAAKIRANRAKDDGEVL